MITVEIGLSTEDIFKFSDIFDIQEEIESNNENIFNRKEMTENINGTRSKTGFASVEYPLNMYRTASNEAAFVF